MILKNTIVFKYFFISFSQNPLHFQKNKKQDGGCNREREERETAKEALKVKPAQPVWLGNR